MITAIEKITLKDHIKDAFHDRKKHRAIGVIEHEIEITISPKRLETALLAILEAIPTDD